MSLLPPDLAGILPAHRITALAEGGALKLAAPFAQGQVQPASLDLRLGVRAWRMRASFLPGPGRPVSACIANLALHEIDLERGAVLETGCVYVAELQESLALPSSVAAAANPKSSTGRIDVFTRVITDRAREFDMIEQGYNGPLYAEISPRTFPVLVRAGSRLSQVRFRQGHARLDGQLQVDAGAGPHGIHQRIGHAQVAHLFAFALHEHRSCRVEVA